MHNSENWDHLRYVLAVARAGSVNGAARDLGVNHATVLRHVAAFEERAGTEVFEKSARGYEVPSDRLRLIDAAKEVEAAMLSVRRILQGAQAPLRGLVRVTSTDSLCQTVLPPIVAGWQGRMDQLHIELLSSNAHLDFSRMQTDITVRPAPNLGEELKGVVAAKLGFDVYAIPDCPEDRWLGLGGILLATRPGQWMADNVSAAHIAGSADSFMLLRELAAAEGGQVILPCVVADMDARLTRRPGIIPDLSIDIWVASHRDLADVSRIKAVRNMLVKALGKQADRLAGKLPEG